MLNVPKKVYFLKFIYKFEKKYESANRFSRLEVIQLLVPGSGLSNTAK